MGFFDKFSKTNLKDNTTKGFYFGSPEAEAENKSGVQNLKNYFDDFLQTIPQIEEGRFIILGRKGSGKSAVAKFFKENSSEENQMYCEIIRSSDIELEKVIQYTELNQFENKEEIIFEWIILAKLVKLILLNKESQYTNEFKVLQKFYDRNSGVIAIDKFSIQEITEQKKYEVSFDVLRQIFRPVISKYFDYKTVKAPFFKLIPALKEIIATIIRFQVHVDKHYLLIFDDLDINFKVNNTNNKKNLLELIRTAKFFNNELFKDTKTRVIIMLRDDIKKILDGIAPDKTKMFTSYEIPLDWYDHSKFQFDENHTNLKKFINRRIDLNFKANSIDYDNKDPWGSLIKNQSQGYGDKTAFKYILDYTFYRPRDFILFFNNIGKEEYPYPLDITIIKQLLRKYVQENIGELKDELCIHFDSEEILQLFEFLKNLSYNNWYDYQGLEMNITNRRICNCTPDELIRLLIDYSLIIPKDKDGNLYFSYRERNPFDYCKKEDLTFSLHKCLYLYFNPNSI